METIGIILILIGIALNAVFIAELIKTHIKKNRRYFIESVYLLQLNTDIVEEMKYNLTNEKYK